MLERQWRSLAVDALLLLFERESAVVWPEVEAKIAERVLDGLDPPVKIDPHHLTTAKGLLLGEAIEDETASTRGGRPITIYRPIDPGNRKRAIADAAARKRLLYARYLGWASGSASRPSVIGPAGEKAANDALGAAARYGYTLLPLGRDGLHQVFGADVPGGPLDNGALLQTYDAGGRPAHYALMLIEVKNVRGWIYPTSAELADLLYKAATLQGADTGRPILPVLFCRRAHVTTKYMASQLGFLVHETHRQFISLPTSHDGTVHDSHLAKLHEVQAELGFRDLVHYAGLDELIVRWLRNVPPSVLPRYPERWGHHGPPLTEVFRQLRTAHPGTDQAQLGDELRTLARSNGAAVSW